MALVRVQPVPFPQTLVSHPLTKYAYIRVSKGEQEKSGLGIEHQAATCRKLGKTTEDAWGADYHPPHCIQPGFFVDVGSAFTTHFERRPGGKKLLDLLRPGDTLCFSRLDRVFRSTLNFCTFSKLAIKNNWNLVCADPPINLATPDGRMMASVFAAMAEWESDIKSARIKEALAAKKQAGLAGKSKVAKPKSLESDYRPKRVTIQPSASDVKPGRVFVYLRCSHRYSADSGLGLRYSLNLCCEYAEALIEEYPQLEWDEGSNVVTDAAVSALSTPIAKRPHGGRMNAELREGDVVIIQKPDRVFCSIHDMSATMIDWKKRGVTVHFAQGSINLGTPFGELMLSVLVAFAQFERQLHSTRAKETRAVLEDQGKYTGGRTGNCPPFWRAVRSEGARRLVLDVNQIVTFRLINTLRLKGIRTGDRKLTIAECLRRCEAAIAKIEGRDPIPACGVRRVGKWAKLPKHYLPSGADHRTIFPMWTKMRFDNALAVWPEAFALWASQRDRRRVIKDPLRRNRFHRAVVVDPNRPKKRSVAPVRVKQESVVES